MIKCGNGVKDPGEICYSPPKLSGYGGFGTTTVLDVAVADLGGTTTPEVVVLCSSDLYVFSAVAPGDFTVGATVNTSSTSQGSLAIGEVTGDSQVDAVVTFLQGTSAPYGVYLVTLAGDGAGSLAAPGTATPLNGGYPTFSATWAGTLGDANADGLLDLFVTSNGGLTVQLATSAGVFAAASTTLTSVATGHVHLADLTGDARPEVIASHSGLSVGLNDGTGVYSFWSRYLSGTVVNRPLTAQMDGDGLLDMVFGTSAGGVSVLHGNGFGGVIGDHLSFTVAPGNTSVAFPVDITSDGCIDIVAFNDGSVFSVLPGLGHDTFDTYRTYPGLTGPVQMADLNGDGIMDFVSATSAGLGVVLSNP